MPYRMLIFLYPVFLAYRLYFWNGFWNNFVNTVFNAFFDALVSIIAAWIVYNYVEKRWRLQRRPIVLILLVLLIFAAGCTVLLGLHWLMYTVSGDMKGGFIYTFRSPGFQIFDVLTMLLIGMAGAYSGFKIAEANESRKRAEMILQEKKEAELQFLKSQVNPHFIFNSLNALYFSIDKSNHQAREIVTNFSDLLRFQLYECSSETIPLNKEIAFISQYLYLNEIRMNENMDVKVSLPEGEMPYEISPLLLIPFIENALKHSGSVNGDKSKVDLQMEIRDNTLTMDLTNTKRRPREVDLEHSGIGIANVRRRLQLLYPKRHELSINEDDRIYNVKLRIPLV